MSFRALTIAAIFLYTTSAVGQSVNYKSTETTAGVQSQLDYFATGKKDCTAALPPTIRVITLPKHGLLTIRRGTMTTPPPIVRTFRRQQMLFSIQGMQDT